VFAGVLSITDNAALTSIAALRGLTDVGLGFILTGNGALADLTGLEDLTSARRLVIHEQPALTSLAPLHGLVTAGDLSLQDLDGLASLHGLEALRSIDRNLTISGNAVLADLDGLATLATVTGAVRIEDNAVLPSDAVEALLHRLGR
jgi:hypothetical protein